MTTYRETASVGSEESVTTWIAQLKAGRLTNADQVWQRYKEQLIRLARRKLGSGPRRVADEEDVVLSAFDGFLNGVANGRFVKLDDRDDLWQILVMLTERRAIAVRRRERAGKRGAGKVRGGSVFMDRDNQESLKRGFDQAVGKEITPAFAVEITEQLRHLLDQLPDETLRQIALGKLASYTNQELATSLGLSLRAVERKLSIIRNKWRHELDA